MSGGGSREGALRIDEEGENNSDAESGEDMEALGAQEVVAWIKAHIVLPGFSLERHWQGNHDEVKRRGMLARYFARVSKLSSEQSDYRVGIMLEGESIRVERRARVPPRNPVHCM